ncbi:MAG: hypothetical protein CMO01_07355 [Thalassobius sp.]|nr:hypothetical protein [Thalassovita sp.]
MDFWEFQLDEESRAYITNDFINRVGIRDNVVNISARYDSKLMFNSNDNFDTDSVFISCGKSISKDFLIKQNQLMNIRKFQKVSIANSNK